MDDAVRNEIKFIDFLEDSLPNYLLMITHDKVVNKSYLHIEWIKKNAEVKEDSQSIYQKIETDNRQLGNEVREGVRAGTLTRTRKKSIDNFELVPDRKAIAKMHEVERANSFNPYSDNGD